MIFKKIAMERTSEVYSSLYHYTTFNGLMGILTSQSLWATHYKFLNDSTEIVLFKEKLGQLLYPHILGEYKRQFAKLPRKKQFTISPEEFCKVAKADTVIFIDTLYRVTGDEIYIISFCGNRKDDTYINRNGILSQWRGYGSDGGFAIEFDTKKLEIKLKEDEEDKYDYDFWHISDVVYSNNDQKFKEEIAESGLLEHIGEYVQHMIQKLIPAQNNVGILDATKAYPAFIQCISRYKHHGFTEENEVRIVTLPAIQNEKRVKEARKMKHPLSPEKQRKFLQKNGKHTPYIELFRKSDTALLSENIKQSDITLPIKRIIVGPHKDKDVRTASLRTMLRNTDIEVHLSDIPYIGN